jgi:glycosyltransferase involved in cell wall biosynthesis
VLITGADPLRGKGGGSNLVRSHARAAHAAGLDVHVFCLSDCDEVIPTPFGHVHRVRTPFRPRGNLDWGRESKPRGAWTNFMRCFLFSTFAYPLQCPFLARAIDKFLGDDPTPVILQGFWLWGVVALEVAARRRRRHLPSAVAVCMYTTGAHELAAKIRGVEQSGPKVPLWWFYRLEKAWQYLFTQSGEKRVCKEPDALLFDYESARRLITETYGPCPNGHRIAACPASAFDTVDFEALNAGHIKPLGAPPLIVTVSRHDGRKGLDVLLKALAILKSAQIAFRAKIGSGGELLEYHRQLAASLDLSDRVEFTGWLDDPNALLAQGDLYVLPSLEEGSGSIALVEAMRAGLPIIASGVDGIPEAIRDGEEGLLVQPGNAQALAEALTALLLDVAQRNRLGLAAAEAYCTRHSPEALTRDLSRIYDRLLESKAAVPSRL